MTILDATACDGNEDTVIVPGNVVYIIRRGQARSLREVLFEPSPLGW